MKSSLIPLVVLMGAAAGAAQAADCRTATGETVRVAAGTPFTAALPACFERTAGPAGAGAKPTTLSPLLRLYETPNASVDVTLHGRRAVRRVEARPRTVAAPPAATITVPREARPPRPKDTTRTPRGRDALMVRYTPGLRPSARGMAYAPAILGVARAYNIDPAFMGAVARRESGINPAARSKAGALGMMQVMPGTAARFGVRGRALSDPLVNLAVGASYLKSLQRRYGNNLPLILAAYNAGEGAVDRHGRRIPPYRETQAYVSGILGDYGGALRRRGPAH